MIRYVFKDAPVAILNAATADPQRIGEAIAEVAEACAGRITPTAVVEAARDRRSPLHIHFEWDDRRAANAYREDQARDLIRCIRVEEEASDSPPVRAFLSVRDNAGIAYHTAAEVAASFDLQVAVLKQAERDLEAWERRYRDLASLFSEVGEARQKIRDRREAIESRVQ